jgi:hypothetical protein
VVEIVAACANKLLKQDMQLPATGCGRGLLGKVVLIQEHSGNRVKQWFLPNYPD